MGRLKPLLTWRRGIALSPLCSKIGVCGDAAMAACGSGAAAGPPRQRCHASTRRCRRARRHDAVADDRCIAARLRFFSVGA
jgi:hypothetical protein